jgi:hypothetical protein
MSPSGVVSAMSRRGVFLLLAQDGRKGPDYRERGVIIPGTVFFSHRSQITSFYGGRPVCPEQGSEFVDYCGMMKKKKGFRSESLLFSGCKRQQ